MPVGDMNNINTRSLNQPKIIVFFKNVCILLFCILIREIEKNLTNFIILNVTHLFVLPPTFKIIDKYVLLDYVISILFSVVRI